MENRVWNERAQRLSAAIRRLRHPGRLSHRLDRGDAEFRHQRGPPGAVSIQFTSDDHSTEIVVLRQLTKQEAADGAVKAMRELEKREIR